MTAPLHSPRFGKEWSRFDRITEDIDPHRYEVAHVEEGGTHQRPLAR